MFGFIVWSFIIRWPPSIIDHTQLELKDFLDLKFEQEKEIPLLEVIEIVIKYHRYFMADLPKKIISAYSQDKNFLVYFNDLAKEMLSANHNLIEALHPCIKTSSVKGAGKGERDFVTPCIRLSTNKPIPST